MGVELIGFRHSETTSIDVSLVFAVCCRVTLWLSARHDCRIYDVWKSDFNEGSMRNQDFRGG